MANQMTPQLAKLLAMLQQGGGPVPIPVEGGTANQIVPAQPVTPAMQNVAQVQPEPIAPMPQPRPPVMAPAQPAAPMPPQPQAAQPQGGQEGGISSFFNIDPRLGRMLEGVMSGAASADPTQPFLKTMGQGFVGARGSREKRESRKRDEIYAQNKEDRAGRREGRDERRLGLNEQRTRYGALKTAADIEKTLASTREAERKAKSLGLTANEVIQIANATNKFLQGEIQRRGGEYRLDDDDMTEIDESARAYRDDLTRRAQEAATGEQQGQLQPGDEAEGSGTYDDPFRMPPGDEGAAYEALPSGAIFINPSDGKLLRKP